jgi:two-component system nitrate/nitrite response regulator NarL
MMRRITVLVADDHPLFRRAVTEAIKTRPELELVGSADDGRQAVEQARVLRPDVLLLDMRMPELDGIRVVRTLQQDSLPTRALFLAASTASSAVYEALSVGASGYLDKTADAREICDAIVAVANGRTVVGDGLEEGVWDRLRSTADGDRQKLTLRELEVLGLLAEGLSGPAIAKQLYVEPSTIKSHLKSIYRKLGVADRASAVAEGMRRSLVE